MNSTSDSTRPKSASYISLASPSSFAGSTEVGSWQRAPCVRPYTASPEDSSSLDVASPPMSPCEPSPKTRSALARKSHHHMMLFGFRPRGFSPPRRFYSHSAWACCSPTGRGSWSFHTLAALPLEVTTEPESTSSSIPGRPVFLSTHTPLEEFHLITASNSLTPVTSH